MVDNNKNSALNKDGKTYNGIENTYIYIVVYIERQ